MLTAEKKLETIKGYVNHSSTVA